MFPAEVDRALNSSLLEAGGRLIRPPEPAYFKPTATKRWYGNRRLEESDRIIRREAASSDEQSQTDLGTQKHTFAFQTGTWRVHHRKLIDRLVGSTRWEEFGGHCRAWETLAGGGNVEDHEINDPRAPYRAGAYRMLDPATDRWSRSAALAPPVVGRFAGTWGHFFGADNHDGRAIQVRFVWTIRNPDRLEWEQAFSVDAGEFWESDWIMSFSRA